MRMGNGSMTSTPPASHTAWIVVTRERVVGPIRAT